MLFQQLVYKLATSLLRTYLVDKLLEQHCHNLLSSLLQARCEHILLTSCWNSITTTSLSSKIASASNTFCAAILDVYFRILRCAVIRQSATLWHARQKLSNMLDICRKWHEWQKLFVNRPHTRAISLRHWAGVTFGWAHSSSVRRPY